MKHKIITDNDHICYFPCIRSRAMAGVRALPWLLLVVLAAQATAGMQVFTTVCSFLYDEINKLLESRWKHGLHKLQKR